MEEGLRRVTVKYTVENMLYDRKRVVISANETRCVWSSAY